MLTDSFPFPDGEQFLETEILAWADVNARLIVLPLRATGSARPLPKNAVIDTSIARGRRSWRRQFTACMRGLCSPLLYDELRYLQASNELNLETARCALGTVVHVMLLSSLLSKTLQKYGGISLAYCYWTADQAYAVVRCRPLGLVDRIITRAHRFDIYGPGEMPTYSPLKRSFINEIDEIHSVSNDGRQYLIHQLGLDETRAKLSHLGVEIPLRRTDPTRANELSIVSISFCNKIKRLDLIIRALALLAERRPHLRIKWTHLGGGPLLEDLRQFAKEQLCGFANIRYALPGQMTNQQVHHHISHEPIDFIVNASRSEGIPVSIMEAMSRGIPAIAPAVGGIPELIKPPVGVLLTADPSANEIAGAMEDFFSCAKNDSLRAQARETISEKFNARINYPSFLRALGLSVSEE